MHLYLHIPFCDSKCHYCAFNSYTDKFALRKAYMDAILKQLEYDLRRFSITQIETLFIGGGTPSTIEAALYAPFFEKVRPYLAKDAEITSEANPNSATPTWLEGMMRLGVNRFSFGVQSFDERKLKLLGRAHSAEEAKEALLQAKALGIKHLSLDLIYDLACDDEARIKHDIDRALDLGIDHLSCYELIIEEGTPYASKPRIKKSDETLNQTVSRHITAAGFEHYEVSNYGKYRCKHNLGYWKQHDYLGLGAGAVGFAKDHRYYPPKEIERYLANPLAYKVESLNAENLYTEMVLLGLRSCIGIKKSKLHSRSLQKAHHLQLEGKLTEDEDRYYASELFLADALALYILD